MKIEDGRNEEVQEKSLDTTQDSSGLGNRIVVEDEEELPSCILNGSFNDALSSTSEHTPEASRSSSPSVSMHLRHVDRNLSPSPEPVLQHQLAPLILTNRTPSPSPSVAETFPLGSPSLLFQQIHLFPIPHQHRSQCRYYPPIPLHRLPHSNHCHISGLRNRTRMEAAFQSKTGDAAYFNLILMHQNHSAWCKVKVSHQDKVKWDLLALNHHHHSSI